MGPKLSRNLKAQLKVAVRTVLACGLLAVGGLALSSSPAMAEYLAGAISGHCTINDHADPNFATLDASTSGSVSTDQTGSSTQDITVNYVGERANDRMSSVSVKLVTRSC